MISCLCELV